MRHSERVAAAPRGLRRSESRRRCGRRADRPGAIGASRIAGLVDDLATSGEVLREKFATADVVLVSPGFDRRPKNVLEALAGGAQALRGALLGGAAPAVHERVRAAAD